MRRRLLRSRGTDFEHFRRVKRLALAFLVLASCRAEHDAKTATIAPAESRPAPPVTTTLGSRPAITTSGSPPPREIVASGSEAVTVREDRIDVRPLLPRGQTAFRIENLTSARHHLILRGTSSTAQAEVTPGCA